MLKTSEKIPCLAFGTADGEIHVLRPDIGLIYDDYDDYTPSAKSDIFVKK